VPRVGGDQSVAPLSAEQHLLQLLIRKQQQQQQQPACVTAPQQQALIQMLLQSSAQGAARQPPVTTAFTLANLPSTAAAAAVPASQVPRPRAIKSQHSQSDAIQHSLQHDLLKTDAAKLAEASKLAELAGYVLYAV